LRRTCEYRICLLLLIHIRSLFEWSGILPLYNSFVQYGTIFMTSFDLASIAFVILEGDIIFWTLVTHFLILKTLWEILAKWAVTANMHVWSKFPQSERMPVTRILFEHCLLEWSSLALVHECLFVDNGMNVCFCTVYMSKSKLYCINLLKELYIGIFGNLHIKFCILFSFFCWNIHMFLVVLCFCLV